MVAKPSKWSGLTARLLTAVAVVVICIVPFYMGGIAWGILVAIFAARIMYEWVRMTDPDAPNYVTGIAIAGLFVALSYAVQGMEAWAMVALIVFTVIGVLERLRRGSAFWTAFGYPYVIVPAVLLVLLRGDETGFMTEGFTQLVFVILVVIAADVGAYFGGSTFGGPKLAPKLSPNKTWSGVMAGLTLASLVAAIAGSVIGLSLWASILLAVPIVILSVLGDLLESTVKRRVGVKDAGSLLPGHGGLLDRLDSLMAAVVGASVIFMLVGDGWPVA
ncbi:MAG: phosphatidate cytidylyltransferase [Pseudomonadota bacterium]